MKINKSLDIDLNIISPQRNIQIHEGDIDSIDIVLAVSVDDVSLDLTGLTIKYDATINNYLAEQDANGAVVENKIVIPVTENMTAMPGLLLIDVRMIQGDEVLFTQTISAIVDKAVVNGSTYIDFSKITIIQRMNALEEQMTYVEELVDGLDTSKQITSNRRPPQTAPSTVDFDFFRVGDTWIYQGFNIVYKLVEVEYNYQPDPEVPAVHKLTWQPLNEYFSFGTSEPPTSAVYTPIEYVIGDLTFNALPVPEYFKGDTYAQLVSGEIQILSVLTNAAEVSSGQYTFTWHENGGGGDVIRYEQPLKHNINYTQNDLFIFGGCICRYAYSNYNISLGTYNVFTHFTHIYKTTSAQPPNVFKNVECPYETGDLLVYYKYTAANITKIKKIFVCTDLYMHASYGNFITEVTWEEKPLDYYSKDEINQKGYLTLETLPIYDGTVI